MKNNHKPSISVYSLSGCAGEELVILENLPKFLPFVEVKSFGFAQSNNDPGPCDISFVEGTVSQPHDLERLKSIRANSRYLVAVGNCAVYGCVQKAGCKRYSPENAVKEIYGDMPIDVLPPAALSEHVEVDVKLSGCPINGEQLLPVVASLLKDHLPYITSKPVCLECKLRENGCVLIEKNLPCLGPITAGGCGALCPSFGAACYGCWGPCAEPQMEAMALILTEKGFELNEVLCRLTAFGAPDYIFMRDKN
jgi:coenzyme F420-reducing hydrogenase gamma subunit